MPPAELQTPPPTTVAVAPGGTVDVDSSVEPSLQGEALRALCWGWLGLLVIYACTVFGPMFFTNMTGGAYDIVTKALAIEEKLMIALTSSLMTAVTMASGTTRR